MSVAIEFLRVDAVLHENETDVGDIEVGFLFDFAPERSFGGFAPFDLAARDAPKVGPFLGANHKDLADVIEDEAADGGDGRMALLEPTDGGFDLKAVLLKDGAEFSKMLANQIRRGPAELGERVITRQHGDGMNAAVPGGFNVVRHVADKDRLFGNKLMLGEDIVDFLALVPDADERVLDELPEVGLSGLNGIVFRRNGGKKESADPVDLAEFEKFTGVRQGGDGFLNLAEATVKPLFQLWQRNMRRMQIVKSGERQLKIFAELIQGDFGSLGLDEHIIGGLPNGWQIIHKRARPVKDDVSDHRMILR